VQGAGGLFELRVPARGPILWRPLERHGRDTSSFHPQGVSFVTLEDGTRRLTVISDPGVLLCDPREAARP
jgi:hypothetical protein